MPPDRPPCLFNLPFLETNMNNLWWKQWQENKRYLAAFMAWMTLGACYAIAYQISHKFRAPVGQFSSVALFYAICAAVFLATRTARGEDTDGTQSFTAALPISMRRIATLRILGAAATLILPILAAAALISVALSSGLIEQAVPRLLDSHISLPDRATATLMVALGQLWSVAAISAFAGIELLLLLSVAGCWLRNQSQIGLMGGVMAFGSLMASGLLWTSQHRNPVAQLIYGACFPQSLVIQWGYGSQHGDYVDHEIASYHWIAHVHCGRLHGRRSRWLLGRCQNANEYAALHLGRCDAVGHRGWIQSLFGRTFPGIGLLLEIPSHRAREMVLDKIHHRAAGGSDRLGRSHYPAVVGFAQKLDGHRDELGLCRLHAHPTQLSVCAGGFGNLLATQTRHRRSPGAGRIRDPDGCDRGISGHQPV